MRAEVRDLAKCCDSPCRSRESLLRGDQPIKEGPVAALAARQDPASAGARPRGGPFSRQGLPTNDAGSRWWSDLKGTVSSTRGPPLLVAVTGRSLVRTKHRHAPTTRWDQTDQGDGISRSARWSSSVISTPRMATPATDTTLDAILAIQLTIAWAGEGRCSPRRLGWWDTDLIDEAGGGDFLKRLLPQTHAWASLEAVREAARRTDEKARKKMADPDEMRTIFFLGFELDEQLADRLGALKRGGRAPSEALPLPLPLTAEFSKDKLIGALQGGDAAFTVVPGARQLKGARPAEADMMVRRLAAALVPFADQYPLPFYKLEG
jgi:hypothetical protein